jgi:hypothetical protein
MFLLRYKFHPNHTDSKTGQLSNAKNIFLAHIQSETPYFQAGQLDSVWPYDPYFDFANDPIFDDCKTVDKKTLDTCREAWALRIVDSRNVYLYGGGFYSFFQNYDDKCAQSGNACQDKLIDIDGSENIWLYSLFTVGAKEVVTAYG